jgi:hypothetical protein
VALGSSIARKVLSIGRKGSSSGKRGLRTLEKGFGVDSGAAYRSETREAQSRSKAWAVLRKMSQASV